MASVDGMRLDELAHEAGLPSSTIRLYQNRGLLPSPRLVGRTGFYDESHLHRLGLIGRLQEQGFSLAGIGQLVQSWEQGRDLTDLLGMEAQVDGLVNRRREVRLEPAELAARFPPMAFTPELVQRAASLGLLEATDDGRVRVADERFVEAGSTLMELGVPAEVVLDEWERLAEVADGIARRFIAVFEEHVMDREGRGNLDTAMAAKLSADLGRLVHTAHQVVAAAVDASIAEEATRRLGDFTRRSVLD